MDKNYKIDLTDIYDKYYVGLYGVNRNLEEVLRRFSDDSADGSSIVFYEYLLHQPIPFVEVSYFSEDEFKEGYTLKGLCDAIKKDIPSITIENIDGLNQLITKDDLYEQVTNANKGKLPSKNLKKINESYTKSKDKDKNELKRCNRLLLDEFYKEKTPKRKSDEEIIKDLAGHIYLLAPFATRMVETHNIVPAINSKEKWGLGYREKKSLSEVKLFFKFSHSYFTKISYEKMAAEIFKGENKGGNIKMMSRSVDTAEGKAYYAQIVFNPKRTIEIYKESHSKDPLSLSSVDIIEYLFKIIFPNHFYNKKKIYGLVVPIASNRYFYGCLWLMCFCKEKFKIEDERNLIKKVREIVSSHYVPVMALIHENISEELLENNLLKKKEKKYPNKKTYRIPFLQVIARRKNISGKPEIIEVGLEDLWNKRSELSRKNDKKEIHRQMILRTLLFTNYRVASQTMVDLIRNIIMAAKNMKKNGSRLPAALVIGGAGSGKDTIGKMLRIFTDSYFEGEEYTINLAAIKPSALVPIVMTGAEFNFTEETEFAEFIKKDTPNTARYFEGLFQKIRKEILRRAVGDCKKNAVDEINKFANKDNKDKKDDKFKEFPTLILDEFNSMDSESQGVLLRFLENSEALSLGSLRNGCEIKETQNDPKFAKSLAKLTDCLVIGVMNEDPDAISREKAVDFLKEDSYLGGLLGDILYEHFIKIRRLRPDIKYRMMRNGMFVIKPLKDRREDIPILFHVYLKPEIKDEKIPVHLSLEAMERLISKDITWPGNIRQLQSLAKHVSELVQAETKYNIETGKDVKVAVVERRHIDSGLDHIGLKVPT